MRVRPTAPKASNPHSESPGRGTKIRHDALPLIRLSNAGPCFMQAQIVSISQARASIKLPKVANTVGRHASMATARAATARGDRARGAERLVMRAGTTRES
jgi:hypothetical protein